MSRLISVASLAVVFVIVSGPGTARAQSHAGGLPAVSDRVTVLEGITANLQSAVTTLQTAVTTLQGNVTTLQTKVTTLETKNTDLQSALNAEVAARKSAIADLQDSLDVERFARTLADNLIKARLDSLGGLGTFFIGENTSGGLVMGAPATVVTIGPLPAGNYLVVGTVQVRNSIHDVDWLCDLLGPAGEFLDGGITFTQNNIDARGDETTLTLAGIARVPTASSATVRCQNLTETGGSTTIGRMFAVRVGQPG